MQALQSLAVRILTELHDERLLQFDARAAAWTWDLESIRAKGFTDNVVDFMVAKLGALPARTRDVLETAACIGFWPACAEGDDIVLYEPGSRGSDVGGLRELHRFPMLRQQEDIAGGQGFLLQAPLETAAVAGGVKMIITPPSSMVARPAISRLNLFMTTPLVRWVT